MKHMTLLAAGVLALSAAPRNVSAQPLHITAQTSIVVRNSFDEGFEFFIEPTGRRGPRQRFFVPANGDLKLPLTNFYSVFDLTIQDADGRRYIRQGVPIRKLIQRRSQMELELNRIFTLRGTWYQPIDDRTGRAIGGPRYAYVVDTVAVDFPLSLQGSSLILAPRFPEIELALVSPTVTRY